ncbi:MAG TPA: histidinol-phosphate transaminase [Propioniciclava tarda]|mgnify:FL=1|nr:histidinol-phosphate transaminase [Propioniciclava tarda]
MSELFDAPSLARLRPALAGVPAYVAGRPAKPIPGLITYKVSSNENPYPPLPSVAAAIAEASGHVNRYPDMMNVALKAAIGESCGFAPASVTVGPGSTGVLAQLIGALCDSGDEVVFAWRSFEAYPILVRLAGATPVMVALNDAGEHDLDAMAAAVTDRTKLVILCTPNNPTGPIITDAAARAFLAKVPAEVVVIIDEAYVEFVRDSDAVASFALQRDYPNVVVTRTFSKAYGLAGLRVGYGLAHPTLAEASNKTSIPFSVNLVAQAAAIASLAARDEIDARVDAIVAERQRVVAGLAEQGWRLPATSANFVYFPLGPDESERFDVTCGDAGLVVRRYGGEGVRVTIGEEAANSRLLEITGRLRSALRT